MIIINKSGYLKYKDLKFRCSLGKAGIGKKKEEGDNITPKGIFKVNNIFYRKDRVKKIFSCFKLINIKNNMGWCDDPKSKNYNQLIKLPTSYSCERLFRKDNLYNLILTLNYNISPTIKNKGSAIFIHVAKRNFQKTKGCIGLKESDLKQLVEKIKKNTKIKIY